MALSKLPKIDILMATYNGEKYIREQIESLQNQSYRNWTLLISDDGSTDNTLAIVEAMQKADHRIKIVARNAGFHSATKNFLSLLKVSSAPYVMFCDQDDVWLRDKIETSLKAIQNKEKNLEDSTPVAVFSDSYVTDELLNVINPSFVTTLCFDPRTVSLPQLVVRNVSQGATMMLNNFLVREVKGSEIPSSFEYHDHWIAAAAKGIGQLYYIDKPTFMYRQHSNNVVGADERIGFLQRLFSIARTFMNGDWIKKMAEDEQIFSVRANDLLCSGLPLKEDAKKQLELLASVKEKNRYAKITIIRKYKLLRNKGLYAKAYQLFGILLD